MTPASVEEPSSPPGLDPTGRRIAAASFLSLVAFLALNRSVRAFAADAGFRIARRLRRGRLPGPPR